jgi:protein tyrosine/serine phosphatase
MTRLLRTLGGIVVVIALIVGPVAFAVHEQSGMRNFRVVREGVLYRSGQMSRDGLKRIFFDYGIRTVICLRDGTTAVDQAEEAFINSEELNYVRIPPTAWGDLAGAPPAEEGVRKFREVMSDPHNYPVLVHCLAGIHRTGIFTAIYRMEFERWTNAEAMEEMRTCGYVELDEHLDVLGYLEQYRPAWMQATKDAAAPAPALPLRPKKHSAGKPSLPGPCGPDPTRRAS